MKDRLSRDDAHLWVVRPERITDPELLRSYEALLTRDEQEKRDRLQKADDRHYCLVTRALVRCVLSRYVDVAPDRWRFVVDQHGRPEVSEPRLSLPLRFNLSHTMGLIVCGVTIDREIGVDVEERSSRERLEAVQAYFSPFEVAALSMLTQRDQDQRMIEYWTLKESYLKAKGTGLAIPLARLSFNLDDPSSIRVFIDPRLDDDPDSWQFAVLDYDPAYTIATSTRRHNGVASSLRVREIVPLRD